MWRRLACLILLLCGAITPLPASAQAEPASLWQTLAPGIEYRSFYLPGPNRAYVARLDRTQAQATIESSLGLGRVSGGLETVRGQAERYDQALSAWGGEWGSRSRVVVAINGSYFDTQSGIPTGGVVQSGWYARRFDDRHNSSGFAWTLDRQAFIGMCVIHRPGKQFIAVDGLGQINLDAINLPPGDNQLTLYSAHYDFQTPAFEAGEGLEVVVELAQPLLIMPEPQSIAGTVREVRAEGGTPLAFDQIVLSARGAAFKQLDGKLKPGDGVQISQELRHLNSACQQPNPNSWTKTYASVGGGFIFLADGVVLPQDDLGAILRNPRTAVAYNQRYVYFIVVDGRDALRSQGMSMVELAVFARQRLNAAWGIAQDGGGSSTMVVNGVVVNNPNADSTPAQAVDTPAPIVPVSGTPAKIERAVANGLMMVLVEPRQLSSQLRPGQTVQVQEAGPVNLRLGPGTNYAILQAVPNATQGVIVAHALNGVQAKGYAWWKVDFGGLVGWVNQQSLAALP